MKTIQIEKTGLIPGQAIVGELRWENEPEETRAIELRLFWYTEGKGDRDVEIVETKVIESVSDSGQYGFEFEAPTRPYSFSGKLISLIWAVEAISFPDENTVRTNVVISSDGNEVLLESSFEKPSAWPKLFGQE